MRFIPQQEPMQLEALFSRPAEGLAVVLLNYSMAYFAQIASRIQIYLNLPKKHRTSQHWANNPVPVSDSDLHVRQSSN